MDREYKVLNNPEKSGADITNYRISEIEFDPETNRPVINPTTGMPKDTGNTYEWSITKGETLRFPAYVAEYLLLVYGFLREVKGNNETEKAEKGMVGNEDN